jgi:hypothetical protein
MPRRPGRPGCRGSGLKPRHQLEQLANDPGGADQPRVQRLRRSRGADERPHTARSRKPSSLRSNTATGGRDPLSPSSASTSSRVLRSSSPISRTRTPAASASPPHDQQRCGIRVRPHPRPRSSGVRAGRMPSATPTGVWGREVSIEALGPTTVSVPTVDALANRRALDPAPIIRSASSGSNRRHAPAGQVQAEPEPELLAPESQMRERASSASRQTDAPERRRP